MQDRFQVVRNGCSGLEVTFSAISIIVNERQNPKLHTLMKMVVLEYYIVYDIETK